VRGGAAGRARRHRTTAGDDHRCRVADNALPPRVAWHASGRGERADHSRAAVHSRVHVTCLREVVTDLSPSYRIVALAIREPPFPELPDTVATVRQSYQLQCAADGMIYQIALCAAARDLGLEVHLCGRGEENARVAARLHVNANDVESFVRVTGRPSGPPWTEEHRRAYAAGIAVLASGARHRIKLQR